MTAKDACAALIVDNPVAYADSTAFQEQLVESIANGSASDTLMILQHRPVITLGSSAKEEHILASPALLKERNIDLCKSPRGGDVTYHGPGQLVFYPVLRLREDERDVHDYVRRLETVAIRTSAEFGIESRHRDGKPGAWTSSGKIAAIGVRIRRWITSHGMSLNVDIDLEGYRDIVPCGLAGERVTSMRDILGAESPATAEVLDKAIDIFSDVFERQMEPRHVRDLPPLR